MKEIYDWVPWFTELARKIANSKEQDVIACAKQVRWNKEGKPPQLMSQGDAYFDPFSLVYYIAARSKFAVSRKQIYPSISKAFEVSELGNLDSEDNFIFPTGDLRNALFNDVANKGPSASNPDLLWKLFRGAVSGARKIDGRMFDRALAIPHVAITKLTHALYLTNPHAFVPADSAVGLTKSALPKNWDEYKNELEKARRLLPNCMPYEINPAGYLFASANEKYKINVRPDRCFHVSSHVYGPGEDLWEDFKSNNWVYTGGPKSGTPWRDYDGGALSGGYPLSEPKPGDVVLVRRGVKQGLGIGVVYKNDFESSLSEQSKLHVIWVNKNTHQLTGQTEQHGFRRAKEKTLKAFHSTDSYKATFDLLRSLGTGAGTRSSKAEGEVRDRDRTREENTDSVDHAKNLILYGPPGTGKTWKATRLALAIVRGVVFERVEGDEGAQREVQNLRFNPENPDGRIEMVTFHQNYSYEDFVEGIRPRLRGEGIAYELRRGTFRRMADAAASDPDSRYVLIIDEINRGNIAKILGELITLIEASRRAGANEATYVSLPYSGDTFSVPGNLYIIGTMNTADRSIQLLDTALRRRFRFEELMPNPEHELVPNNIKGVNCRKLMRAMNERITTLLDREHQIGHTNFFEIKSMEELADRFQHKIFPLLQEYFFDDWGKIRRVLNNNAFVSHRKASNLPASEEQVDEERVIYERLRHDDEKWSDPEEYKAICVSPDHSDR